ncbi:hypothetical protein PENTCL1PPCAC_28328, partial [Pristionchus entomophagus]
LLLLSLFQAAFSHGILTLHFYSVGLDLSRIDCVLPFPRSPFNDVQPIRTEHDCEIYVRACLLDANYVGDSREPQSCGRTESFPFTRTFTGGISFPIWNVTTSSMVTIQFRSPDFPLDNYLYQNHQYDINRVRSGNDITNKTLKSRNFRGFVRGIIDCGEGYDLEFTKYSCVPNPASVDPFRAVRVIESGNRVESSTVTEKEDISPIAVTNPAPALVNQQRHAIYCDSPDCGSSIIFFIMGFSIFMFGLSLTVCYFVAKRSRDPSRRLHESTTTVPSIRSRTSLRSSIRDSPV